MSKLRADFQLAAKFLAAVLRAPQRLKSRTVIVHGRDRDREECIARLKRSLGDIVIGGIHITMPLFQKLPQEPDILSGDYDINWLEQWAARHMG